MLDVDKLIEANVNLVDYNKILQNENKILSNENEIYTKKLAKIKEYCKSQIRMCKMESSDDEWDCCIEELNGVLEILEE